MIVEGRRWLESRLKFLEGLLEGDPPEEQRQAIEAEIENLRHEHRSSRFRRWLRLHS
jgi:hypothetical protein